MTPYSNSAALWADVARLAFCLRHLPIWASFRKKIIEDAMTRNILQEESCKSSNKLSHHPIMIELPLTLSTVIHKTWVRGQDLHLRLEVMSLSYCPTLLPRQKFLNARRMVRVAGVDPAWTCAQDMWV